MARPAFLSAYDAGHIAPVRPDQPHSGTWLVIPSLSISVPIEEAHGSDIPYWTAVHYPGTPAPGTAGNSYVYGHGTWGTLGALLLARIGDRVELVDYSTGVTRT